MSDERDDRKLLEQGAELGRRLQQQTDAETRDRLFQARQRALRAMGEERPRPAPMGRGWLAAAAVAGIAALSLASIARLWDGNGLQDTAEEPSLFLASNPMDGDAPWSEDPEMLQNIDFSLWLDMAGPEDAG